MTPVSDTNIVVLMTDQHRIDTLGCYGNQVCQTPAIDGLAARGVRFANAFTPTAMCTPSRASLLTGVLPFRHGLLANHERNVGYREELDERYPTFAGPLRSSGYQAGHVGKWHAGARLGPADHGFDGIDYPGWGNPVRHPDYLAYLAERGLPEFSLRTHVRGTFPNGQPGNLLAGITDQPAEATFEYYLAERTIERLRGYAEAYHREGRPFYLACDWFGPHLPYCLPESYYRRYDPATIKLPASLAETFDAKPMVQRHYSEHWAFDTLSLQQWRELTAAYWGYVTLIDEQAGRILAALEELDLAGRTMVAFTADHGEFTGSHRLHDKGPAMYDDIYRIPLVIAGPGMRAGVVEDRFATLMDLTPTLLELAGTAVPEYYDGTSLVPLLRGDPAPAWRDSVVAEFHGHHFPYPQRMLRTTRYKLVINPADRNELYDLAADPDELHNRYDHRELREVRDQLMRDLYDQLRDRGDNFYHWMTSMFDVGAKSYDAALSQLDDTSQKNA
ncbi:MAG TPA: sulfatase-like hydrolase/transferase [Trebonia sp.]|nr:sulfatase-like hydrolase/transferase [Trebonia sp.]